MAEKEKYVSPLTNRDAATRARRIGLALNDPHTDAQRKEIQQRVRDLKKKK